MSQTRLHEPDIRYVHTGYNLSYPGDPSVYDDVPYGYRTTVSNDIAQRVKPSNLIGNMTGQAEQSVVESRYAVWKEWTGQHTERGEPDFVLLNYTPDYYTGISYPETDVNTRMRNKVKGLKLNLSSYVAEVRETADMFTSAARRLVRTMKALKRGDVPKASRILFRNEDSFRVGDVSAVWLLSNFALSPMIGDSIDALTSMRPPGDVIIRKRVSASQQVGITESNGAFETNGFCRTSERGTLWFKLRNNWKTYTGGNPLESLWEGIPLSFVVDYFSNVGDYLSSIDALDGVDILGGCVTRKRFASVRVGLSNTAERSVIQQGHYRESRHRRVTTTFPLDWPVVIFENGASVKRLLNLTAIAHQQSLRRL